MVRFSVYILRFNNLGAPLLYAVKIIYNCVITRLKKGFYQNNNDNMQKIMITSWYILQVIVDLIWDHLVSLAIHP